MENYVCFLGDISFNGIVSSQPELNGWRYKQVAPFLQSFKLVLANLESPVSDGFPLNPRKTVGYFSSPAVTASLLQELNIGCVSLANNHIFDYLEPGLEATIRCLDQQNIKHTGAGWLPEHVAPVIFQFEKRIAFLAYVDASTNPHAQQSSSLYINYLDVEKVIADVLAVRNDVDYVICSLHWGADYSYYPTRQQRELAHRIVDAGVDMIMGHHSHTMQPMERYKEGLIFYGLGGLTYGDDFWRGELRALRRKTKVSIIPCFDSCLDLTGFIGTKELQGNRVEFIDFDIRGWYRHKQNQMMLIHRWRIVEFVVWAKEKYMDRFYEFFFGYYRNGVMDILTLRVLRKLNVLFRKG